MRCLLAAVLFGAVTPVAAKLTERMTSFTLAGLLYLGAAAAVLPVAVLKPPTRRAVRTEWKPALGAVIAGGAVGPVLLMAGLARTNSASASLLLNTELVATVILAAVLFREHLGPRLLLSAGIITAASALLTWESGAAIDHGALLIVAACAAWGLDNGITARIQQLAPEHVVALKGLVAGTANLLIGLASSGWSIGGRSGDILAALLIGALGYGMSITLWVKGARDLGAARAQVIFAAAPFIGAAIAWVGFNAPFSVRQVIAAGVAAVGVAVSLRSDHVHAHHHHPLRHTHEHVHDDGHHGHRHEDFAGGRHTHEHTHGELVHAHPHVPDLHHDHNHP